MRLYAVYNTLTSRYGEPMAANVLDEDIIDSFRTNILMSDDRKVQAKYKYMQLYYIGEYDPLTGVGTFLEKPKFLKALGEFVPVYVDSSKKEVS